MKLFLLRYFLCPRSGHMCGKRPHNPKPLTPNLRFEVGAVLNNVRTEPILHMFTPNNIRLLRWLVFPSFEPQLYFMPMLSVGKIIQATHFKVSRENQNHSHHRGRPKIGNASNG